MSADRSAWPELPLAPWRDTLDTLHLWTQVVGKVKLALAPVLNHWWGITLDVTPRGLTTGVAYHGDTPLRIDFDFVDHQLVVDAGVRGRRQLRLEPRSVADFHGALMATLDELGTPVRINATPNELEDPIAFDKDERHASYDAAAVERFQRALLSADRVLRVFRARWLGKSSPVQFFWGSFDLAVTRFSGRVAPIHPGGFPNLPDWVTREAYSHEVCSAGWWPGHGPFGRAAFYAYAYPNPDGFANAAVQPDAAFYSDQLSEYLLPWDDIRSAPNPQHEILGFLQTTYEAAAEAGDWPEGLEREPASQADLEAHVRRSDHPIP